MILVGLDRDMSDVRNSCLQVAWITPHTSSSPLSIPVVPMTLITLRTNDCCAERQLRNSIMRLSTEEGIVPSSILNTCTPS